MQRQDDQTLIAKGIYAFDDVKMTVKITELPVGTWTKDYNTFLDVLNDAEETKSKAAKAEAKKAETGSTTSAKGKVEPCSLKGFDDLYNDVDVRIVLYFTEEGYDALK